MHLREWLISCKVVVVMIYLFTGTSFEICSLILSKDGKVNQNLQNAVM